MSRGDGEVMIRLAARRLGLQAAAMVAVVVLVVAGLGAFIVVQQENSNAQMLVTAAASNADDVIDPPAGMWVAMRLGPGAFRATKGMPDGLPDKAALDAVAAGGPATTSDVTLPAGHFLVYSVKPQDGRVVQSVLDLRPWEAQRDSLLNGLFMATLVGLLFAAVAGVYLARRALSPLQRTLRLQRQFVADASHELRTPLTLLHTRVQLLNRELRDETMSDEVRAELAGVVRDSSRLTDLVEDLLLAADGGAASTAADVEVGPLAAEVVAASSSYAEQRGVRLDLVECEATARASAPALRRALIALVDNAIEHTPSGGAVTVTVERHGSRTVLRVDDTGPGFSDDQTKAMTTRFHSGGQRAGRRRYGLGLALVSDIADRYGGRLEASSEPGRGASFALSLPGR